MNQETPATRRRLMGLFFAAGCLALTIQVVLLRELLVALQGDETAVGLGLGAWLGGIAAGAAAARSLTRQRPASWAGWGFGLLAAAAPLLTIASRLGRRALAPPPGELLSLGPATLLAVVVLAPAGFLVGLTFTALAAVAGRAGWGPGRGIARLYVLESLGSLAGGLAVTFLFIPKFAPLRGIMLAAGTWCLAGAPASRARIIAGRWWLPGCGLLLAGGALLPLSADLDAATVRARFAGLAPGIPLHAWIDTPYQHAAIGGDPLHHLYMGGQYAGSFPDPAAQEALAHQVATLAPHPESVLAAGSGAVLMLRFLLEHPVKRLDLVEIDRRALGLLRRNLPPADEAALADPRVRIVTDDPRRFLARTAGRYDLILILEPPPVTLLLSRLSTVEFYRLCAARLAPDGVIVIRLETAPNVLTGETAALGGSLWGALRAVFPVVHAGPGPDGLAVAGTDPRAVTLDPAILAERFIRRGIVSDVFVPQLFGILFPPERVAGQEAALAAAADATRPSRDERPVSFPHALALRQRAAGSLIAPLFGAIARAGRGSLAIAALLPSLVILTIVGLGGGPERGARSMALAATHAVAATGAAAMTWSLLILFSYQTRAGALYGKLGLLVALFMLGLALGGQALSGGADLPAGRAHRRLIIVTGAGLLFALAMPAALRGVGLPGLDRPWLPEIFHGALLLAAGLVTGALFPVAAGVLIAARRDAGATASILESADHVGAALAALIAGVVFVPALGLAGTAWLVAALQACALLVVLAARARRDAGP